MNNTLRRKKTDNFKLYVQRSIRRLRLEKKWSQAELAKKLGVDQATISNYESGKTDMTCIQLFELFLIFGKDLTNAFDFTNSNTVDKSNNEKEKD